VVLVGVTGSGKSTLAKYITQDPNLMTSLGNGEQCYFIDKAGTIGQQSQTSMTTVPNAIFDDKTGQLFIDCPGFEDTRKNPANDIAAAFFVKKVFEEARRIKIVLVENHFALSFGQSRDAFLRTIQHVARLIPNGAPFIGSFGMIVTKVDSVDTDEDIIYDIRDFVNDTLVGHLQPEMEKLKITNNTKEMGNFMSQNCIIEALLESADNIGIFRVPCKEKVQINTQCSICHTSDELRKLVFERLLFTKSNSSLFQMSVSQTSLLFIKEKLIPDSEKAVENKLSTVTTQLIKILEALLDKGEYTSKGKINFLKEEKKELPSMLDELCLNPSFMPLTNKQWKLPPSQYLEELNFEVQLLQFFYSSSLQNFTELMLKQTESQKTRLGERTDILLAQLKSQPQFQSFFDSVHSHKITSVMSNKIIPDPEISFPAFVDSLFNFGLQNTEELTIVKNNASQDFIARVTQSWNRVINFPASVFKLEDDVLYVCGTFIFLSEIVTRVEEAKRLLYVIATKAIYVDTDLNLKLTHLILRAPVIEVVGSRSIQMLGIDGQTASSSGQNGFHGYSSGSMKVLAGFLENGPELQITSMGGNGSDGKAGNSGSRGREAELSYDIEEIIRCLWGESLDTCKNRYHRELFIEDYDRANHYIASTVSRNGLAPTSGENGGNGGIGGLAGDISILQSRGQGPKIIKVDGKSGDGGQGGGEGGSVCIVKRYFIKCNLYLFSSWVDKCHVRSSDCWETGTAIDGVEGKTPQAMLQYSYPVPDESVHYKAEAYLLRSLATNPDSKKLMGEFVNVPSI